MTLKYIKLNEETSKPVITVKEARKILGKEHLKMTDEEIMKLVDDLSIMAKHALIMAKESRRQE